MEILRRHHISFKHAMEGIIWAFKTQPNFRVHIFMSILALILGYILGISYLEFTIIVFCIALGFAGEFLNTSIEAMTDLISTNYSKQAKISKDVSAGMMLIIAFGTTIVAALIFIPKIFILFT